MKTKDIKSIDDLPIDVNQLKLLMWTLILDNRKLQDENILLRKELFGKKSEKQIVADDSQLELVELLSQITPNVAPKQKDDYVEVTTTKRRKKHPGRNAIPDTIITITHTIDLPEDQKNCSNGCGPLKQIDVQKRTVIVRIPATYEKHIYLQPIYACGKCKDTPVAQEMPVVSPLPRIIPDINLLLFVILSKYQFHLPLYRIQRQIYHESRIWFTRSTMVGWIAEICAPLRKIYDLLATAVKDSFCIFSDDSKIKRSGHTSYMWPYINGELTIALFDYRETRGAAAPREFLKGVKPGTYLMTDCFSSYNDAVTKYQLIQMACMMHVRREFVEALETGYNNEFNQKIIRLIGHLYRLERFANEKKFSVEQRFLLRQQSSKPILEKIKEALLNPGITVVPQSRTSKAINYTLGHWERIVRFLERGDLPIDNGVDERVIRDLAIGRKNWMQVMSDEGGKRMAILYSIIATCKLNGINPEEYLNDTLMRMAIRPADADVSDLTPVEWLKGRNGGKLPEKKLLYPSIH
ncbi:MAG TPA: IS66 family transposase [Chitinispirillaceae bacterium]|nr:IS66 family transposase [Chitinispirillaceae bacterium]